MRVLKGSFAFKVELPTEPHHVVGFSKSMEMSCTCRMDAWCDHRADVIAEALEASGLHEEFQSKYAERGWDILVPIIPSKGLYAPAFLQAAGPMISIEDPNFILASVDRFYGIIGPEDGLGAIRLKIVDYITRMLVESNLQLFACPRENKHNMKARMAMNVLREEFGQPGWGGMAFEHNANVFLKRLCATCSSAENYDDVTPKDV